MEAAAFICPWVQTLTDFLLASFSELFLFLLCEAVQAALNSAHLLGEI